MKIDFYAGRLPHFADHTAPIWNALPHRYRGNFHAHGRAAERLISAYLIDPTYRAPQKSDLVVVASFEDYRAVRPSPVVMVNHGIGQTYRGDPTSADHPSYSGGSGRERVVLYLCPSDRDAEINRLAYPGAQSVVIGVPKLDRFHRHLHHIRHTPPTVAITFHHDTHVCPETRWALPYFRNAITQLAADQSTLPFRLIGHAHPRFHAYMEKFWKGLKVTYEPDPITILDMADLLVFDNTSFGYEFASTNRPVVVLNPPWYRREVNHQLRFWEAANVGIQVNHPDSLLSAILLALSDPVETQRHRRAAISLVYSGTTLDGQASQRAAQAIVEYVDG